MIQSPYRRGAEDGLVFGIYLTVLFYSVMLSQYVALLSLPALAMMAGVPVVIFLMMRRYASALGRAVSVSALWMQGLVIFACGCAIGGAMLLIYLRWIEPDFFADQLRLLADMEIAPGNEWMIQSKDLARQILDSGAVPRAIDVVIQLILLGIVSGSLLSLVIGAIVSAVQRRKNMANS